ncbi:penicillin-binding protein 2 [Candidatus Dojkabacteria bacterium]|nr:penicillin-binding protein 2 [Candidatus Dojkabacteria bacterium]
MKLEKYHQRKIKLLGSFLVLFFLLIAFFLIRWQVVESEKYKAYANQRITETMIPSIRGAILAADGSTLAYSEPRFDIYIFKKDIEEAEKKKFQTRGEFIEKVSSILENKEKVEQAFLEKETWIRIADKVSYETKEELFNLQPECCNTRKLQGIFYELSTQRIYPEGALAPHVLGFVGKSYSSNELGRGGIEQFRNGILSPQEGYDFSERDSFGNIITLSESDPIEARRGSTLITTIDKTLQQKVEEKLEEGVNRYEAKSGTAIIMDPKTGKILAMANYPDFDPNKYYEIEDQSVFRNNGISSPYEMGSVMKAITMSAGIDSGKITPNTVVVESHEGCEHLLEEKEVCTYDKKPQGKLTALDALIKSDNIALYHTAKMIGQDTFYKYLKKFGIGSPTGIDLTGESYSSIPDSRTWNLADLATYSYGHSYQVTPIQTISAVGALANGGKLMQPYIVQRIIDPSGEVKEFNPVVVTQVVKPETAVIMQDMMHEVFKSQTKEIHYQRAFKEYRIALKSGTALIPCVLVPEKNCYGYSSEYNATYIGFDASDEKSFIMLIRLERPRLESSSSDLSYFNARHVWLETFDAVKDYIGVPKAGG